MYLALNPIFISWAIINLFVGLWEVYAWLNRSQLKLERTTIWEKILQGRINLANFWLEGWSEYCKVDARYIMDFAHGGYVWGFELLNAILAYGFILALVLDSRLWIKLILLIGIANCILYFVTLLIEKIIKIIRTEINKNKVTGYARYARYTKYTKYAKWWQYPLYYLISAIWLIVPAYLYWQMNN